jgi:hypothetical protein
MKYKIQLNDGLGWFDDRISNDDGFYVINYFVSKNSAFSYTVENPEYYENKSIRVVSENILEEWSPYQNELLA